MQREKERQVNDIAPCVCLAAQELNMTHGAARSYGDRNGSKNGS